MPNKTLVTVALASAVLAACNDQLDPPELPLPEPSLPMVPQLHLQMQTAAVQHLYNRTPMSDERLPGAISIKGDSELFQSPVSLRFRGNSTRWEPKKGFNIRFDDGNQDFLWGGDRINARSMWRDPSLLREHLAYWFFAELDLLAPQTDYYELWINESFEGLYLHVERIDRRFLRARDLNRDGTLVRDQFRVNYADDPCGTGVGKVNSAFAGLNLASLTNEQALLCLEQNFDDRRADWQELLDLLLWVESSEPGADFAMQLEQRIDLPAMIDFFAVHLLIGDRDSIWGNDYWLYKDHQQPGSKWQFIPWDKNLAFGSHWREPNSFQSESGFGGGNLFFPHEYGYPQLIGQNQLFHLFLQTPQLLAQLEDRLAELLGSELWQTKMPAKVASLASELAPYGRPMGLYPDEFRYNQENHMNLWGDYQEHVEQVSEFLQVRTQFLQTYLDNNLFQQSPGQPRHQVAWVADRSYSQGESIWLVDDHGFSLGQFVPSHSVAAGTSIHLAAVDSQQAGSSLSKAYQLESSQPLAGRLHLYYRNDSAGEGGVGGRDANWYLGGLKSIGNQWQMQLHSEPQLALSNQQAAPLINRLSADVELPAGQRTLIWAKLAD